MTQSSGWAERRGGLVVQMLWGRLIEVIGNVEVPRSVVGYIVPNETSRSRDNTVIKCFYSVGAELLPQPHLISYAHIVKTAKSRTSVEFVALDVHRWGGYLSHYLSQWRGVPVRRPTSRTWRYNPHRVPVKTSASVLSSASSSLESIVWITTDVSHIAFATELQLQLVETCSHPPGQLITALQKQISSFSTQNYIGEAVSSRCNELDSTGTALWNLCTRLRRNYDTSVSPQALPNILILTRVFAFFLLNCALVIGKGSTSNVTRVMKIGIKAAKNSLGINESQILNNTANISQKWNK